MRANKSEGYEMLIKAAKLGHREASSTLLWARLLGYHWGPAAKRVAVEDIFTIFDTFKGLAETGLPSAHLVCMQ
jgi:TPR repeat protein